MEVVVSPYHLTTREAPAMASLLLAERVITLVPGPFKRTSATAARRAAERAPRYSELMERWGWSAPLWSAGVVVSQVDGDEAARDMREIARRIGDDHSLAPLRPLMREQLFDSERGYLEAVGADLLKGGPDPGITVPIAAGLDRFAVRHGLLVARPQAISVVQRAEARLGQEVFCVALPVMLQASAERLIAVRELLEDVLVALRNAIDDVTLPEWNSAHEGSQERLKSAARAYAQMFEREHEEIIAPDEDDDLKVMVGTCALSLVSMPFDAVLRSSVEAAGMLVGGRFDRGGSHTNLPVKVADGDGGHVLSLVVRPLGGLSRR